MRRVVVTGMAGLTSLGSSWDEIKKSMAKGINGIKIMEAWKDIEGMNTCLGGPLPAMNLGTNWSRKQTRTMGPVALYAVDTAQRALAQSGLLDDPILTSGRTGVAYGSSFGSTGSFAEFCDLLFKRSLKNLTATSYIRLMSHTTAVNIGLFFGLKGRIIPTSTACTSGSMAIGYGAEAIRYGLQDVMIVGGAEELCPSMAAVFDTLFATSIQNESPKATPRPFDAHRDGLVIGEGAATLVLEDYEHAKARGASILAEVRGFGTTTDGAHVTQPATDTMEMALRLALLDARMEACHIGFISGHGTATEFGDLAESQATYNIFGQNVPFHALKSYFGHTLGACGAMEAWLGIEMLHEGWWPPTLNLDTVDPRCAPLDYVTQSGRFLKPEAFMTNNFAFGGINTSLIVSKM